MSEFKVGDRCVVLSSRWDAVKIGNTGVIVNARHFNGGSDYDFAIDNSDGFGWFMEACRLEKISTTTESIEDTTESQNKQILNYLQSGATINPMSALELFGSFRLSARINDLRNDGHNIKTTMVYNGRKRWANYNLVTA